VVAVGAAGEQPEVGVGGLGAGVGQAVRDGIQDQGLVVLDGVLLAVFDDLQLNIDTTKATVINTNTRFISYTF